MASVILSGIESPRSDSIRERISCRNCHRWHRLNTANSNDLRLLLRKEFIFVREVGDKEEGKEAEGDGDETFNDLAIVRFFSY